jgi:putative membrane protein
MNGQENGAELAIMSLVMVVLSILGIIAGFSRGLFGGIDGLLILGISLMMVLIFALLLVVQAKQQGWIGKHSKEEGSAAPPAAAK